MASLYKILQQQRHDLNAQYDAITSLVAAEERGLTEDERVQLDGILAQNKALDADLAREEDRRQRDLLAPASQAPAVLRLNRKDTPEAAYCHYVRTGQNVGGLMATELPTEFRAAYNDTDMNITTAADGGYVVPTGLYNGIIARRDEMALFAKLGVTPIPGIGTTVRVPIDNEGEVIFAAVSEAGSVLQDAPALYYKDFTLAKYGKYITLSWELLRDEDANLLAFINNWLARGLAGTENSVLLTEVGSGGTAGLTLDSATAIGAKEIPELVGKLMPEYQDRADWLMHPTTWAYLQGLSGSDQWYFANGLSVPNAPTLFGFPAHKTSYATAYAASAKSLVFGNFQFMGRRQGTTLQTLRDPYTGAGTGQVKLWFWFDVVYGVLQAEAIQYATHPTG